ncbi:hypothetical protein MRS44_010389 [Fusarium solani]|uniref:uncharacterized protein n=1 Tax=Fusarium solani TaxID=169388 RepID=UPI0032C4A5F0|nr:hypothetical protein MRS44_010389 [Fusarium solani]
MRPVLPANHPLNNQASGRSGRPDSLVCGPSTAPTSCFITSEADLDARRDRSRPRFRQQADRRKRSRSAREPSTPRRRPSPARTDKVPSSTSESEESIVEQDPLVLPSRLSTPSLIGLSRPESPDGATPSSLSEVGKSLGKLKIMVSGRNGIGKTSLIKTLAQRCEHIVHMDPIENSNVVHATETYASSRPHPWWRSDSDLTVTTRRRISTTGDVLDRNVCFVESPRHQHGASGPWRDLHYVESHLASLMSKPMADSDLLALVNSGGVPVVDALLYLIPHNGLTREDVQYIKHAQGMTNVIPVLTRADELAAEEIEHIRQRVAKQLANENIDYFSFDGPEPSDEASRVYAISTKTQTDYDTMDASVLMNSEYNPPLVPTDLSRLVDHIFSLDGSARLRHAAAIKCVKWRRDHGDSLLQSALSSGCMVSRTVPQSALRLRPFRQSQSWERLELYNWANNLRQSLHSERLYHLMEERSNSNAPAYESSLVRLTPDGNQQRRPKKRNTKTPTHQDPLGLLQIGGNSSKRACLRWRW